MNTIVKKIMSCLLNGKGDSESYIKHLRKIGVKVGDNVIIYSPYKCDIDEQNPHMLEIGNNVKRHMQRLEKRVFGYAFSI